MAMNPRLLRPTPTGFDPRRIAGLAAWWDSTDNSTITTDTGVSAWADKVNGYSLAQSTGANQPTISSINGKQAFDYNGSSQFLSSTDAGLVAEGAGASAVNPTTIFYVLVPDAVAQAYPVMWGSSTLANPAYCAIHPHTGNVWRTFYRDDNSLGVFISSTATYAAGSAYVVATATDTNIVGHVNGSEVINTSNTRAAQPQPVNQFAVGCLLRTFAGQYVNGQIGDVLVYNRVLTASERQKVERWLAGKFGATLA
jgi:hypothetical protein